MYLNNTVYKTKELYIAEIYCAVLFTGMWFYCWATFFVGFLLYLEVVGQSCCVALTLSWITRGHSRLKRPKICQCLNIHVNLNDDAAEASFCCSISQCYLRSCILLQLFTAWSSLCLLNTLHIFQIFLLWLWHNRQFFVGLSNLYTYF